MYKVLCPRRCLSIVLLSLLVVSAVLSSGAWAVEVREVSMRPGQIGLDKADIKSRKADSALAKVLTEYENHVAQSRPSKDFKPSNPKVRVVKGRVLIDARAAGDGEALFNDLVAMGLTHGSRYGSLVSGYLPLGAIKKMLALESLRVASASLAIVRAGDVTSQGDGAMKADLARSTYGVDGTDVKVGVLSNSYDCLGGAATAQANDDLPADVTVLDDSGCASSGTDEGRAMMEIVHDVAPGASLAFHTALNGMADFAEGIVELANAGANVIVDDVIYLYEPMFQDGPIAQAVDSVVNEGAAYFSAAGNAGRNGYASPFANSGEPLYVSGEYRGFLHDFDPTEGIDWQQAVTVPVDNDNPIIICYQWDQPWGGSTVDMDIYLHTWHWAQLFSGIVASSQANNNIDRGGSGQPSECLQFTNTDLVNSLFGGPNYKIMLAFFSSGPDEPGENNPPPPGLTINQQHVAFKRVSAPGVTDYRTESGTLYGHANAAGASAVGAAFYDLQVSPLVCGEGRETNPLECYSSAGGVPIYFDVDGNPLGTPEIRNKPNIVAPDGGNTTFFGFDIDEDPDPYLNFFGTSAAAPHAAGVAALMLDADPELTPFATYARLEETASYMGDAPNTCSDGTGYQNWDFDTGCGFVQADAAVAAVLQLSSDCSLDSECDDGLYCNGAEVCDAANGCQAGTPVVCDDGVACTLDTCDEGTDACSNTPNDANCPDDGLFCNGSESCNLVAGCVSSGNPCGVSETCNETTDACDECTLDADCDDSFFCTGPETCVDGSCQSGTYPCGSGEGCDEGSDSCFSCNNNGTCDTGETCNTCSSDCPSSQGAVCGNGVCEPNEDCVSCGVDCRSKTNGKPSNQYCCSGDSDGGSEPNPVDCSDQRCRVDPWQCSFSAIAFCCGDGTCDTGEDGTNCAVDCSCTADVDCDDSVFCNGMEICDPSAGCVSSGDPCDVDYTCNETTDTCDPPVVPCVQKNDLCSSGSDCCSGSCKPNGSCR